MAWLGGLNLQVPLKSIQIPNLAPDSFFRVRNCHSEPNQWDIFWKLVWNFLNKWCFGSFLLKRAALGLGVACCDGYLICLHCMIQWSDKTADLSRAIGQGLQASLQTHGQCGQCFLNTSPLQQSQKVEQEVNAFSTIQWLMMEKRKKQTSWRHPTLPRTSQYDGIILVWTKVFPSISASNQDFIFISPTASPLSNGI